MKSEHVQSLVIGAGPAGLMAASGLLRAGRQVVLVEAKPSVARKFLMAGKSGLNLTKDEAPDLFATHFHGSCAPLLHRAVADFGPDAVARWAKELGQPVFTGSSGRVFPESMKASPLLRAWMQGLASVDLRTRWRWVALEGDEWRFETPQGPRGLDAETVILALGGASWPRLGSDAAWVPILSARGVDITPFAPANAGLSVDWTEHMRKHFGTPVKAARLTAGDMSLRGEFVISSRGLEGSAIYSVSRPVREGADLFLDLCPDLTEDEVARRLARPRGKASLTNHLRKTLRLDPARIALLMEFGGADRNALASRVKSLPVAHQGLRPIGEAISSAGGISAEALEGFRLRAIPNTFAAGEMLDWEAPTGGYLITGCLATGRAAGRQALSSVFPV
ncbi:TIGR03862 family flavoprotein [Maritimibacter dapengensis]|uniref:TIGR03862 family flavoprotein n=1 Tax=Maritimibacter dapengensis TaxID=2836868 RepID=A0ABS6T4T5_9RHOB|nr:TIGR03862 family flavoprotein [Maritimibacter dapengensis]MBV7380245.1 TIGR03862 family flavoprotein [Maritimibacter dapengensis]